MLSLFRKNRRLVFFMRTNRLRRRNNFTDQLLKPSTRDRLLSSPFLLVRTKGLEPPRRMALDPKSSASTNSATSAICGAKLIIFLYVRKFFLIIVTIPSVQNSAPGKPASLPRHLLNLRLSRLSLLSLRTKGKNGR